MTHSALISVDWGTTTLRCCLLDAAGAVVQRHDRGPGILAITNRAFGAALTAEIAPWRAADPHLPIVISGMIGSRQGWHEVPYQPCPADAAALARNLFQIDAGPLGVIHVVPGLAAASIDRTPDVMRGEETQIIGAMALSPLCDALFVLPGTHSKWATVTNGTIDGFATYMTGEIYSALRHHTILGRLMPDEPTMFDGAAFDRGVAAGAAPGQPGALLHRLFSTRTLVLFDQIPASALESYLSGLLIGAELATATSPAAAAMQITFKHPFTLIGSALLSERYLRAAHRLALVATQAPPDCAARGHWLLAGAAGLLAAR